MVKLSDIVADFLESQGCVVVSTIDQKGFPHSSCKDIVKIDRDGRVYLLDAYQGVTLKNLTRNPSASITAFDEHRFVGYCLKGKAKLISKEDLNEEVLRAWESRITSRVVKRLLKNIKGEKGQLRHPEISFPEPNHMIMLEIEEVVDLRPHNLHKEL